MKHATRAMTATAALIAIATLAPAPVHALPTNTLTDVILVSCQTGADSYSHFDVPAGQILVTVVGACVYRTLTAVGTLTTVSTPCDVPPVHNIPCVQNAEVPEPVAVCSLSVQVVETQCPVGLGFSCAGSVIVDGQCIADGLGEGFVAHPGGKVRAHYLDTDYDDNTGYFIVTIQWTPL